MVELELEERVVYRVTGPASINVVDGVVRVQAYNWGKGSRIVIPRTSSLPIYSPKGKSRVKIVVGEGGEVVREDHDNPVLLWEEKLSKMMEKLGCTMKRFKVLVMGDLDSGKTTITTMIANMCIDKGFKVAVIDGDVGQSDIGPPTFISMGIPEKPIVSLKDVKPVKMYFIGDITPYMYYERIAEGIRELIEYSFNNVNADVVVVDTDGWFRGIKAIRYKLKIIDYTKPDAIVIVSSDETNVNYISKLKSTGIDVYHLVPPTCRRLRSRDERKALREQAYSRYFLNAKLRTLKLNEILIIPEITITGKCVSEEEKKTIEDYIGCKIKYCELWPDEALIVLKAEYRSKVNVRDIINKLRELYGTRTYHVLFEGWERGLIAVILGDKLEHVAPAIIEEINYEDLTVKLLTPWDGEVKGIAIGRVKLQKQEDGNVKEVGKI